VVFGKQEGFAASFNLAELNGSNGFAIQALMRVTTRRFSTAGCNGDGFDDLVVGVFADAASMMQARAMWRLQARGLCGQSGFAELDGSNGFVLNGINEVTSGGSVSTGMSMTMALMT